MSSTTDRPKRAPSTGVIAALAVHGTEALSARLLHEHTMRTRYEQIYPGVYVPKDTDVSAIQRATAAWLWSKRRGIVAGQSAAAVLRTKWIAGGDPAELIHDNRRAPTKLVVRTEYLSPDEVTVVGEMRVTSPARTAFDIGRRTVGRVQAVQRLDALANATRVSIDDVEAVATAHAGVRGLRRLRSVLPLMDAGAESPQETDARLALIDSGLPAATTQHVIRGRYRELIARVDMAYEGVKVAIEYDGPQHWTDPIIRQRDIDKGYELNDLGWAVIRVSRDLLYYRRATYVRRVETLLRERGMVW
jgi:hypothetical protein